LILDAYKQLLTSRPDLILLLVPRHPERFNEVADLAVRRGFVVDRRSASTLGSERTQVFIGDSMGELMFYYQVSDLAFVGGSLVQTGGHNILEPASIGVASIVGPHTFNFKDITQCMVAAGATIQINSVAQLVEQVTFLLANDDTRKLIAEKGREVVFESRGATDLLVAQIGKLLPS